MGYSTLFVLSGNSDGDAQTTFADTTCYAVDEVRAPDKENGSARTRDRWQQEQANETASSATTSVSQARLDDMVIAFVVDTMQLFSVVDASSFVNLVKSLAPHLRVPTRRMLMSRIDNRYEAVKVQLMSTLETVACVTVTANCWTTFRR